MIILIVPYRDREDDKAKFIERYQCNVERGEFKLHFIHQRDTRPFNRGAMKNIGFLAIKKLYPELYRNFTFVFHDVDVFPKLGVNLSYDTSPGVVSHYYGFRFALGGIFAIKGRDFEQTNGFPSFWGWGLEDNVMQHRCERAKLEIDRSRFYSVGDPAFTHIVDGFKREVSRQDVETYFQNKAKRNGLGSIRNLKTTFDGDMIHVDAFDTGTMCKCGDFFVKDLRNGGTIRMTRPNTTLMIFR